MVTVAHVVNNDLLKRDWVFEKKAYYKGTKCIRLSEYHIKQDLAYSIIHLIFYIYL